MVEIDGMMGETYTMEWHIICESVVGASHERSGRANQDAIYRHPTSGESFPLIVAASDGHGGATYFRSDKGAHFAVAAAINSLLHFQEMLASASPSSWMELEEQLTKSLVNTWRSEVNAHLQSVPFTPDELRLLEEREDAAARCAVEDNPVLAYGATILAVMITESFIAYLQLGDGDILTVSEEGNTSKVFPDNRRHFANETTSLCASDTWRDFQFRLEKITPSSPLPGLILLSTDGYKDSFSSEQEFFKVGSDLLAILRSNDVKEIENNLENWLLEATRQGSGDDISLGMLYRMDTSAKLASSPSAEQEDHIKRDVAELASSPSAEQEEHAKGEAVELDSQSGHCHSSL